MKIAHSLICLQIITLLCASLEIKNTYALEIGEACTSTQYCNIGDVCTLDSSINRKTCQQGPDDCLNGMCGNGYICDIQTKQCKRDTEGGIHIGSEFQNNFTNLAVPTVVGSFVTNTLGQVYTLGLIALLLYLIWGAYKYMVAGGNPQNKIAAEKHIMWAIIGEIIIFTSYGIYQLLNQLLLKTF